MPDAPAFIPGQEPEGPVPLGRFLPPLHTGVAAEWLKVRVPPGAWVLDPFGSDPRLTLEIARLGYRVLTASNNPVARFLLELWAAPPEKQHLQAALAGVAADYKGTERLEPHLRSLYETICASCDRRIEARAFLWERDAHAPFARVYTCPHCGDEGERPATSADIHRAERFPKGGLHRARALERVAPQGDPDRSHVEEALEAYPPRAVYALFTLINRLEGMRDKGEAHLLSAILLAALDKTNALWPHPSGRPRPKQLAPPSRYREHNVWFALEEAVEIWSGGAEDPTGNVSVTTWPEIPPETGGVTVFEGRLKTLSESGAAPPLAGSIGALPRPNPAYWGLSALWAGWLWGHAAAAPFKSVLRRKRYDWAWHTRALYAAMTGLPNLLRTGAPLFGLMGEMEPGFLASALTAAELAGLQLEGVGLRQETDQAQIHWTLRQPPKLGRAKAPQLEGEEAPETWEENLGHGFEEAARNTGMKYLKARGEPSSYTILFAASLAGLLSTNAFRRQPNASASSAYTMIHESVQRGLRAAQGAFHRYGSGESAMWWLAPEFTAIEPVDILLPLADRVEIEVVRRLIRSPGISFRALDTQICQVFRGPFTPDPSLLQAVIASYTDESEKGKGLVLAEKDEPSRRRADLHQMKESLIDIGRSLGYRSSVFQPPRRGNRPSRGVLGVLWFDGPVPAFTFIILASAVLGDLLLGEYSTEGELALVFPGSRAGLISFKLDQNPYLREQAMGESTHTSGDEEARRAWRMLKFRLVQRLASMHGLTRDILMEQLALDPLGRDDPQLTLL